MQAPRSVAFTGRQLLTRAMEALVLLAILITLTFANALATGADLGGQSALAARGDRGGGGGKPSTTTATVVVTPNPVAAGGASYTVTGSGYPAGKLVAVAVANPGCCISFNVAADSSGRISFTRTTGAPGTYTIRTYQYGTTKLLGQTSFVVQ